MLVSRWIPLCHFWMDLCRRRWLLALLHTNLPTNGRRNSLRQKVKSTRTFGLWQIWKHIRCLVCIRCGCVFQRWAWSHMASPCRSACPPAASQTDSLLHCCLWALVCRETALTSHTKEGVWTRARRCSQNYSFSYFFICKTGDLLFLFKLHHSEAGWNEEGVGKGGLLGTEGGHGGGYSYWSSQSCPVPQPSGGGWQCAQPGFHFDTEPRTWARETAAGLFTVWQPQLPKLCVSGELTHASVWGFYEQCGGKKC